MYDKQVHSICKAVAISVSICSTKMYLKICFVTVIFLMILNKSQGAVRVDPLVDTKVGLIRGLKADDGDYSMFLGIPYADVDENNPFGVSSFFFNKIKRRIE